MPDEPSPVALIFTKKQRMDAKAELLRMLHLMPTPDSHATVPEAPAAAKSARSFLDFGDDPLLAPPQPTASALPARGVAPGPQHRAALDAPVSDAQAELRKWTADERFRGMTMQAVWLSEKGDTAKILRTEYPIMRAFFSNHVCFIEHSNAGSERDFSPLARLLSPLRKGKMKMHTAERKMMLLLNADLWHPLPHRMEEELVTRMMEQVKLAVQTAGDGWEEEIDSDSDEDCFVC